MSSRQVPPATRWRRGTVLTNSPRLRSAPSRSGRPSVTTPLTTSALPPRAARTRKWAARSNALSGTSSSFASPSNRWRTASGTATSQVRSDGPSPASPSTRRGSSSRVAPSSSARQKSRASSDSRICRSSATASRKAVSAGGSASSPPARRARYSANSSASRVAALHPSISTWWAPRLNWNSSGPRRWRQARASGAWVQSKGRCFSSSTQRPISSSCCSPSSWPRSLTARGICASR